MSVSDLLTRRFFVSSLQPRPFAPQGYLSNGAGPAPGATPLLPNNGRIIQNGPTRILCIADVRGMDDWMTISCEAELIGFAMQET